MITAATKLARKEVYWFMTHNRAAALATVSADGFPHVATVYCIVKSDFSIYFTTRAAGRKYENLIDNPMVAMTISNEAKMQTVQLTGMATRVEEYAVEQEIIRDMILFRFKDVNWPVPPIKQFEQGLTTELAVFKIVPHELTYANFETNHSGHYKSFYTHVI